jgi:hypothetical protein
LNSYPQIKEDEMGCAYNTHGRDDKCVQNFDPKVVGKKPPGRPRNRCEDNIKVSLKTHRMEGCQLGSFGLE